MSSKSEAKKARRDKGSVREKNRKIFKTILIVLAVLAVAGIIAAAVIYKTKYEIKSISDYSEGLNDDGFIAGVTALDYVKLADCSNIVVNYNELAPSDDEIESMKDYFLNMYNAPEGTEFDDAFVKEHFPEIASTADEFIKKYREDTYSDQLTMYLTDYLVSNSVITEYPEDYIKIVMGITKYCDEQDLANAKKQQAGVTAGNPAAYKGVSNKEYEASLRQEAMLSAKSDLIAQAMFEQEGLTVSDEDIENALTKLGGTKEYQSVIENQYGKGFLYQKAMTQSVIRYLKSVCIENK